MQALHLHTLGGLRIEVDGSGIAELPSQPVRCALFVYLAMERSATRDELAALLWPERSAERARHSLSQTLYELKKQLGEWVDANGERLTVSAAVAADALEFMACAEAGRDREAVGLFAGPFLDGVHLAASAPFETWVERRRTQLMRQLHTVCRRLIDASTAAGDAAAAIEVAQRWTDLEPLDDEAHHRLIELLAAADRRAEALRCYDAYERRIAEELDIQPLDATKQLVASLRARRDAAPAPAAATAAPPPREATDLPAPTEAPPRRLERIALATLIVLALLPLVAYFADVRDRDAGAAVPGAAGEMALAVLPFANLSADAEQAYFADGVTEDLLTSLSRLESLRVVPRASAWRLRDSALAPADIARELAVGYLLTGSVRRDGERVRVAVQLIDVRADRQLWAETFERELTGIFELQAELAERIADALAQRLTPVERARLARAGTANPLAYDLLLRGREYLNRPGEADARKFGPALNLLRQSLQIDPSYARAHAAMSDAFRMNAALPLATRRDSALHYGHLAVAADAELADAAASLGWALLMAGRHDSAGATLERALRLDARHVEILAGQARLAWARGRIDEAVRWQRQAAALDPSSARQISLLGSFLLDLGDLAGAEAAARRAIELAPDAPVPSWMVAQIHLIRGEPDAADSVMHALASAAAGHPGAEFMIARYHGQRGRYELASAQFARPAAVLEGAAATFALQQAFVAQRLGDRRRAAELLARAESDIAALERDGFTSPRLRMQLDALRGDHAAAVEALRRRWYDEPGGDVSAGPQIGFYWIDHDPLLAGLREDAGFQTLLAAIRADLDRMRGRLAG